MASPQAGAATVSINPPLGSSIPGYFEDRKVSGVHDDVLARAVYLAADSPLAILALDCIGVSRETVAEIRERAERELGLPGDRLFVHATHTHTGPPSMRAFRTNARNDAYLAYLVEQSLKALKAAQAGVRPAALAVGSTQVPGLAFNRRYWMKDGTVRTNPGVRNPEVVRPAGPVDSTMHLLAFRPESAPPVLIVNYPLHLDTVGGTLISADFPYFMGERIREELGPEAIVVFLNGACGDINHIDVLNGEPPQEHSHELFMSTTRSAERTVEIGRTLGEAVVELLPGLEAETDWEVGEAHGVVRAGVRQPQPEQIARARELLERMAPEELESADDIYDYDAMLLGEMGLTEVPLEIQALRIGPAALVGVPTEIFTELAQLIVSGSPWGETLVVELANGCEGYLPTARAFAEGGYETRLARSSKLTPDTGEAVVAQATKLLQQLG